MKPFCASCRSARALTLIECMVYMTILFVVTGLSVGAFYQCQTSAIALQRNASEIGRTVRAGEQWRKDVRQSTGMFFFDQDGHRFIRLPAKVGEVAYTYDGSNVWRKLPEKEQWVILLKDVKASEMRLESRQNVPVCSWDIELKEHRKKSRLKPMFSFLAVPQEKDLEGK